MRDTLVEGCHHLPSKGSPKKVIIKLTRRKDIHRILLSKYKLKNLKPESVHLPGETKVFINDSLCLYDKDKSKCKSLRDAGHISAPWVRNGSLRIMIMITNNCDLLFPATYWLKKTSYWMILIFLIVLISLSK